MIRKKNIFCVLFPLLHSFDASGLSATLDPVLLKLPAQTSHMSHTVLMSLLSKSWWLSKAQEPTEDDNNKETAKVNPNSNSGNTKKEAHTSSSTKTSLSLCGDGDDDDDDRRTPPKTTPVDTISLLNARSKPHHPMQLIIDAAAAYAAGGDYANASQLFMDAAAAYENAARSHLHFQNNDAATEAYQLASEAYENAAQLFINEGILHRTTGRYLDSENANKKAVEANEKAAMAYSKSCGSPSRI